MCSPCWILGGKDAPPHTDSCHSTSALSFCIRGWAVGLSEAAVPQRQLPPHHKDKKMGAFPTWTNEMSCQTEQRQCGNTL